MKNIDLFDALDLVDPEFIDEARVSKIKKDKKLKEDIRDNKLRTKWLSTVAAILVMSILIVSLTIIGPNSPYISLALSQAQYPIMTYKPTGDPATEEYREQYSMWSDDIEKQKEFYGSAAALSPFIKKSVGVFLSESNGKNVVYSPLNVFMTLAVMAEMSGGNTRDQILDVLGCHTVNNLRVQSNAIWNANYRDDGVVKSILASSVWLSNGMSYDDKVANVLATSYYTSVYSGRIGSQLYNEEYYEWMNKQIGKPVYVDTYQSFTEKEAISIATVLNFDSDWEYGFSNRRTKDGVFHSDNGDVKCIYMNKIELYGGYYWGKSFTATSKRLKDSGSMYFILPNEGINVNELVNDDEVLDFIISNGEWENKDDIIVNLTIPRMNISSDINHKDGLSKMGVQDCFTLGSGNFSGIVKDDKKADDLFVNKINHNVSVVVDNEGVTGYAYTQAVTDVITAPIKSDINFTVNRPFIFVITGADGSVLFIGVVNQPNK